MAGLNPSLATITGSWAVDTIGLIYLNGAYVNLTTNLGHQLVGRVTSFTRSDPQGRQLRTRRQSPRFCRHQCGGRLHRYDGPRAQR